MAMSSLARDAAAPPALGDPQHVQSILQSHQRCAALGLSRIERPDHTAVMRSDLALSRERNLRLHLHAAPVMEMLLEQIMATQSMVLLTDAQGTVLHSVGHDGFLQRASKVALAPGANWSEPSKGTNAIGTALVDEAPTVVHAGEHYMHANGFLTCSAAPIFDPRGNVLGVLDVSGDHHSYHMHTMGLVKMSARLIENHWLSDDFRHALRLHLHRRPEFIGTLMEGIVAVGRDGRLLGANRSALDQLAMSGAALRMNSIASLFNVTVGAVIDHFRSPMAPPMAIMLPHGQPLHMRAVFNWPTWHALGSLTLDAGDDTDDAMPGPAAAPDTGGGFFAAAGARPAAPAAPADGGLRYLQTGDAQMDAVLTKVRRVLNRDIPILVLGETGTGKEVLARAIHQDSERARAAFVTVHCASMPERLIEAELFGTEDGASTGKLLQANGGTLFLDEIGELPWTLQARLLRVLQERRVTPPGASRPLPVDLAVVSATQQNLRERIGAQTFREDLYHRLSGLVVRLPPLRERSDLMAIVRRILRAETNGRPLDLDADVVRLLQAYHWPGNIRQLANLLRTAAVLAGGERVITHAHLSDDFLEDAGRSLPAPVAAATAGVPPPGPAVEGTTLKALERRTIERAVEAAGGNISVAARRLGISRNTIYRKLRWRD
jgi:transcriptional regulator of acetoin/glycerol metabolism